MGRRAFASEDDERSHVASGCTIGAGAEDSQAGQAAAVRLVACAGGTTAEVHAIVRGDATPCAVLKRHRTAGGHRAELAALRALDGLGGFVPRVLESDDATRRLVLSWVDGVAPSIVTPAIAAGAGRIRRALDDVPCPSDDLPLAEAWPRRARAWLDRAGASISGDVRALATRILVDTPWPNAVRRWCHRDFAAHNWLVDANGRVAAIDFGHARADDPLVDFVHATAPPHDDDDVVDAFVDGWCGALDRTQWDAARRIAVAHGLASLTWGRAHDIARFVALGTAILARAVDRQSRWRVAS